MNHINRLILPKPLLRCRSRHLPPRKAGQSKGLAPLKYVSCMVYFVDFVLVYVANQFYTFGRNERPRSTLSTGGLGEQTIEIKARPRGEVNISLFYTPS